MIEKVDEKNTVLFRLTTSSGTEMDVVAVYAPSDIDSPHFFEKAIDSVNNRTCPHRMIIGDFNTTMSIGMDQLNYDTDPHFKCREYLTGLETGEQFHDIFRSIHPGVKAYT